MGGASDYWREDISQNVHLNDREVYDEDDNYREIRRTLVWIECG
jgi:hypothetical protein